LDQIADACFTSVNLLLAFDFNGLTAEVSTIFKYINNMLIQTADQNIACQDSLKIKQLAARTKTASGFFNLVYSLVYGIGYNILTNYVP
jgi:hypothetical protein